MIYTVHVQFALHNAHQPKKTTRHFSPTKKLWATVNSVVIMSIIMVNMFLQLHGIRKKKVLQAVI